MGSSARVEEYLQKIKGYGKENLADIVSFPVKLTVVK